MLTLEFIKHILFPNETLQTVFMEKANLYDIQGTDFDEKLRSLFHHNDDRPLQYILAPFLRTLAIQHLREGKTPTVTTIQTDRIEVLGNLAYDECASILRQIPLNTNCIPSSKDAFMEHIGAQFFIPDSFLNEEIEDFSNQKELFDYIKQNFLETIYAFIHQSGEGLSQWFRINHPTPFEAACNAMKAGFVRKWHDESFWQQCYLGTGQMNVPSEVMADFMERKRYFIEKWQDLCWEIVQKSMTSNRPNPDSPNPDLIWVQEQFGEEIYQNLQAFKATFTTQYGEEQWNLEFSTVDTSNHPHLVEYKREFFKDWGHKIWQKTNDISPILPTTIQTNHIVKEAFIKNVGHYLWLYHLNQQAQDRVFGRAVQMQALVDLFDLSCTVTPINNGRTTDLSLKDNGQSSVHFYCINDFHWFIYEDDIERTIGDGNCLYNAFGQWLQCLILNKQPQQCTHFDTPATHSDSNKPISMYEENYLSTSLCMLGLFMMINGLICLLTLLLFALISGSIVTVGHMLLNMGLHSVAHTLSGMIGISTPYTATMIATTISIMTSACGYTFFKDFAPPAFSELISINPLNVVFPCFS
ncbi:MAG TPA: hypothetical protein VHD33_08520 [Legionellaceae bacterium]|nr:hypothetical protein [Legionellaceae bacterium]